MSICQRIISESAKQSSVHSVQLQVHIALMATLGMSARAVLSACMKESGKNRVLITPGSKTSYWPKEDAANVLLKTMFPDIVAEYDRHAWVFTVDQVPEIYMAYREHKECVYKSASRSDFYKSHFEREMSHVPSIPYMRILHLPAGKKRRRVGLCEQCASPCKYKCKGCANVFYCSTICQGQDRAKHRDKCIQKLQACTQDAS